MLAKESLEKMLIKKQKEVDNIKKALQNLMEDDDETDDKSKTVNVPKI